MTARPGIYTASNNSGELGPELHGRTDLKQFYAGLAYALNIEPVPQGGARLSPRTRFLGRVRRVVSAITLHEKVLVTDPFSDVGIVASALFPSRKKLALVVFPGLKASPEVAMQVMQVEILIDPARGTWAAFSSPFKVSSTKKNRVAAVAPNAAIACFGVRLRLSVAPTAATTFTIPNLFAMEETANLPTTKIRPFTFSVDQTYTATFAGLIVDFWRDGVFVGTAYTGLSSQYIKLLDVSQRLDTMLMFHSIAGSIRIMRDGADNEWPVDAIPFENIPQVDLGGVYDNGIVDVWDLTLTYPTTGLYANGQGLQLQVDVGGEQTANVFTGASSPNWDTVAAALKSAIEALPSLSPGVTVTQVTSSGQTVFTLSLAGKGNEGHWSVTGSVTNAAQASIVTSNTTQGEASGEPLMSPTRGYAACAVFHEDRLCQAGFNSKQGAILAANSGDYFNLNIKIQAASGAILENIDTDGAEKIQALARARHLVVFTSLGEYFVYSRPMSRGAPLNLVNASRNGAVPGVPIASSETSLFYLASDPGDPDRKGILAYEMTFDFLRDTYTSTPISLLASHIVADVIDAALQRSTRANSAARWFLVRSDGTIALGIMIRNQNVTAFVRWQTAGQVKAATVDGKNQPHLIVQRTVGASQELHLERLEQGLIFDGTVDITLGEPGTLVSGLDMHEGAQVWAQADGYVVGPFTVQAGTINLQRKATHISVGRWTPPVADTLPLPEEVADRIVVKRPKRVHTVRLDLIGTTSVAVGANDQPPRDVPLYFAGQPTDAPPPPFTGLVASSGLVGFSNAGSVRITQTKPGALQWRDVTIEARK